MSRFSNRISMLKRPPPTRPVRWCCWIATEGNTESDYISELRKRFINTDEVNVTILPPVNNESAPNRVLERLHTIASAMRMDGDQGWIVCDVDHYQHPDNAHQLEAVIEQATANGYCVALSRPCFEVWLRMHFPDADPSTLQTNESAAQALRAVGCGYKKSGADYSWITRQHLQDAVDQSAAADTDPDAPIPQNVCSRVYRLMEALPMVGGRLVRAT